jgi:hypothetical protein
VTKGLSGGHRLLTAILQTLCVYLFAGWVYVAIIAIFRPESLGAPLWHDVLWLRRDTFGAVAFAGSFVCYVVLQFRRMHRGDDNTKEDADRNS